MPFEGHAVYAVCPALFDIDPASELGERLLRSGGHVVTCAEDFVHEAPFFRARHDLEYSRCLDLLAPLLVANLLGCNPSEIGGKDEPMTQINEFVDDLYDEDFEDCRCNDDGDYFELAEKRIAVYAAGSSGSEWKEGEE